MIPPRIQQLRLQLTMLRTMFKEIITLTSSYKYRCFRECFITNCNTFKESSLDKRTTTTINALTKLSMYPLINCKRAPRVIRTNRLLGFERVCLYRCIYNQTIRWRAENHSSNAEQKERNAKVDQKHWDLHWKHKKVYRKTYNVTACKKTNTFFKNHKCLKDMLEKQFGNTKLQTLEYKLEVELDTHCQVSLKKNKFTCFSNS